MKFSDSTEFRAALEKHLRKQAEELRRNQDYVRLQEQLAIERFIARLDPDFAILKGGAAVMYTIPGSPHTRDVDLIIRESFVNTLGLDCMEPEVRAQVLGELIRNTLKERNQRDFFRFKVEDAFPITDLKPGHACVRINLTVMVSTTELHFLQLDIALQMEEIPSRIVSGKDLLNFAGVENPMVRTVTAEYLVADKVTLYLEEHGNPDAGRVKDIVHAALLIQRAPLNQNELQKLLASRALHRNVVEMLSKPLPDPPGRWEDSFSELLEPAGSQMTMSGAMDTIRKTIDPIRKNAITLANDLIPSPRKIDTSNKQITSTSVSTKSDLLDELENPAEEP